MASLDSKVIHKKKLDKELTLTITKSEAAERIFVEFASKDGKLVLQRMFQDNYYGREDAKKFEDSIKTIGDLKQHFARRTK